MPTTTQSRTSSADAPAAPPDDPVSAYARDVTEGRIVAGRLVRLACQRHLRDLIEGPARGLTWSLEHAQHALDFFPEFLRLVDGRPFVLGPWGVFVIGCLFGWLGADGYRRFQTAYIEIGKGNAKTPTAAGVGLYCLVFDGEPGAEIYAAASTREQANITFVDAKNMVESSPELRGLITVNAHNLSVDRTRSFFRPISSERKGLDGKRVQVALIDEIQEHLNATVVEKMRAGRKGRRQPIIFEITNAGHNRTSVCWHHHDYSVKVLEGVIEDDAWLAYVCQLDPCERHRDEGKDQPQEGCADCDDFRDESTHLKTNPNRDISVTRKYLQSQVAEAIGMPSSRNTVLRLNFCAWTQSFSRWLNIEKWLQCGERVPDDDLLGRPCFGGLDLGQRDDLSAFVRIWMLADGRVALGARFWIPESALTEFPDRPYAQWKREGRLIVTEGDTADMDQIETEVGKLALASGVRELAYDHRFADQMALHLQGQGLTMVDTPQGYQLNAALLEIQGLVKRRKLCHAGDPILSWMASNSVVRHGRDGEIRLDKDKAADKIDGIAALAMALSRAIVAPVIDESKLMPRGILRL